MGTGRSGALAGQGHWEVGGTGRSRSGGHCQLLSIHYSLDKKLKEVEVKQAILVRWTPSSTEYRELERQVLDNKREYLLIVIIISQADLNVVGKNVSSNVSDHEGPSSVNNII